MLDAILTGVFAVAATIAAPIIKKRYFDKPQIRMINVETSADSLRDGVRGVLIRVDIACFHLAHATCRVGAYFADGAGTPLKDANNAYRTYDGNVAFSVAVTPSTDEYVATGLELFLPLTELHVSPGVHRLSFFIGVIRESTGALLARTDNYHWDHQQT